MKNLFKEWVEGAAPVTVSLVGNVLRPRGRPKRFGRPVVDGVSVKGSRRPPGRTSVIKVTNLTGLELARQAKGSVSVSMLLHQTSFCFVCTHLTSGQKEGDELRRSSDFMEIIKKQGFHVFKALKTINSHKRYLSMSKPTYSTP
ncbi:type IV inositol polyphosphate 5-phosphatase 7-like protein [Tanacetum coccineum]